MIYNFTSEESIFYLHLILLRYHLKITTEVHFFFASVIFSPAFTYCLCYRYVYSEVAAHQVTTNITPSPRLSVSVALPHL